MNELSTGLWTIFLPIGLGIPAYWLWSYKKRKLALDYNNKKDVIQAFAIMAILASFFLVLMALSIIKGDPEITNAEWISWLW